MVKYIFVTGGVLSSVGKGILTSSIGKMLQTRGLKVNVIKIDPYVNVDAGTMNPYMHGEVYVTDDGGETDLDLGWYERFLDLSLKQENNLTTGLVYKSVIMHVYPFSCTKELYYISDEKCSSLVGENGHGEIHFRNGRSSKFSWQGHTNLLNRQNASNTRIKSHGHENRPLRKR